MVPGAVRAQPGLSPGEEGARSRWVLAGQTDTAGCCRMVRQGPNSAAGEGFQLPGGGAAGASRALSCQDLGTGGKVFGAWGRDGREIMALEGCLVLMGLSLWITVVGGSEGQTSSRV